MHWDGWRNKDTMITQSYPHMNIDGLVMMYILDFATLVIWPDIRSINEHLDQDPHRSTSWRSRQRNSPTTPTPWHSHGGGLEATHFMNTNYVCKLKGLFGKLVYSSSGVKDIGVTLSTAPQPGFNYVTAKHGCALETWRQLAVLHLVWYVFSEKYHSSFRQAPWLGCGFCGMAGFGSHIWRFPWRVLCGSWLPWLKMMAPTTRTISF